MMLPVSVTVVEGCNDAMECFAMFVTMGATRGTIPFATAVAPILTTRGTSSVAATAVAPDRHEAIEDETS